MPVGVWGLLGSRKALSEAPGFPSRLSRDLHIGSQAWELDPWFCKQNVVPA